jgi:hypothetical protein
MLAGISFAWGLSFVVSHSPWAVAAVTVAFVSTNTFTACYRGMVRVGIPHTTRRRVCSAPVLLHARPAHAHAVTLSLSLHANSAAPQIAMLACAQR